MALSDAGDPVPRSRREARELAARKEDAAASQERSTEGAAAEQSHAATEQIRAAARAARAGATTRASAPVVVSDDDETREFVAVHPDDAAWSELAGWAPESDGGKHGQHTTYEEVKKHHRRRAGRSCLLLVLVMVLVLGGAGYAASKVGKLHLPGLSQGDPDYSGNGTGTVQITVHSGDTGAAIAQTLFKAGVVKSVGAFVQVANDSRDFSSIQPGRYTLHRKMSASAALAMMLDPKNFASTGVTVPEGLWASQIFQLLSQRTGVPVADYRKVTAASLGLPAAANGHLEGYLFPSTYNFAGGMSAQEQLQVMANEWRTQVATLKIPAGKLHDVMVIASLVEAESRVPSDGPKVARVVLNRIAEGMPLQLDSTIHYAEGKRGTITTTDAERAKRGPYNSYLNKGLPPTPIDNPGLAAIQAALHPAAGSWLYFVTVNPQTGKTLFATTFAQQQANEQVFHDWCSQHPGKC
ncbi:endolytic transglycosylase MltG [Flexivirga caeni]|uniref:Endolytic murein transglycosylase n=1 Tax=Flexivirga caeni TaxID=2294115 RepID=A0A3M9LXL3_9MICO|nr:endolytic transglycosylase MltG [Flexivirga caeni]RNI18050.1 endolytic transglycosylase MltG [Flexivirga caeni]